MDPLWAQVIVMSILVIITAFYATFTYLSVRVSKESREDVWKLEREKIKGIYNLETLKWNLEREEEERKIKNKKIAIRKLISGELSLNIVPLENIIEKLKKINKIEIRESLKTELPEITIYKHIIGDLGFLGEQEVITIMYIHKMFIEIKMNYQEIIKLISKDMNENKVILDGLSKSIKLTIFDAILYCEELEKAYNKLFKGEIDENQLEEIIRNIG